MNTTDTKITLSAKELELVCNADWILTKQGIIRKVYQLYGDSLPALQQALSTAHIPGIIKATTAKIARGENYRELPWVMLDYPRYFAGADFFAVRSFFWWGHSFSVALLVSGRFLPEVRTKLLLQYERLSAEGYFICVHASPWEHHFEADNYVPVESLPQSSYEVLLQEGQFIKIAKRLPLQQWEQAGGFIQNVFEEIMGMLKP